MTIIDICKSIHDSALHVHIDERLRIAREFPDEWKIIHFWFMGWVTPKPRLKKRLEQMLRETQRVLELQRNVS